MHLVFGCLNLLLDLTDGSPLNGRGRMVIPFCPVVCQHPVEQKFY